MANKAACPLTFLLYLAPLPRRFLSLSVGYSESDLNYGPRLQLTHRHLAAHRHVRSTP